MRITSETQEVICQFLQIRSFKGERMSKVIIQEGVYRPEVVRKQILNGPLWLSEKWVNAVDITISNGDFLITKKGEENYEALER